MVDKSKKIKIVSIVGARPQFIKIAPLHQAMNRQKRIVHVIIHTGQHYDYEMSKIFFDDLNIPEPNYNLSVGSASQGKQTGLMLQRIEATLLKEENVNMVIVYGDTNSTLAGALAAVKLHIPVVHVEAGLRSHRFDMPEEVNRVVTDRISTILLCPTKTAVANLRKEGITQEVYLVGDLMYEVLLKSRILLKRRLILSTLGLKPKEYSLLTIHRQENTDNTANLLSILKAIEATDRKVIFPMHPRTKKILKKTRYIHSYTAYNLIMVQPVGYLDMLALENSALNIITDSGGVQKEAFALGVPCITLRKETEWIETVQTGCNVLVGTHTADIIKAMKNAPSECRARNLYSQKSTSKNIVSILLGQNSIPDERFTY